ncbi:MAG: hypothetical protein EOO99_09260 [Pedobacter sp.]|nr:MAG: hypothetical protein EOO99_09260 [Pedobacter sp.]
MEFDNNLPANFICLYFLENSENYVLEIKRTDLSEEADLSDIYKWMRITKDFTSIQPLTFRSMDSSLDVEERYFEEGYLKFNQTAGTFIEKYNSAQHHLTPKGKESVPKELISFIERYLLN